MMSLAHVLDFGFLLNVHSLAFICREVKEITESVFQMSSNRRKCSQIKGPGISLTLLLTFCNILKKFEDYDYL
jgi:hypothetical protein